MGLKKVFRDPPKSKKLIFSKNPNSVICPNMGGGQGSGPSHPETHLPGADHTIRATVLEISRADYAKKFYFAICSSKTVAWIKRDPPKSKKLIFSKNPNSVICPNMGEVKGVTPATLIVSDLLVLD